MPLPMIGYLIQAVRTQSSLGALVGILSLALIAVSVGWGVEIDGKEERIKTELKSIQVRFVCIVVLDS